MVAHIALAVLSALLISSSAVDAKTLDDFITLLSQNLENANLHYVIPGGSRTSPSRLSFLTFNSPAFQFSPGQHSHNATHLTILFDTLAWTNYMIETSSRGTIISQGQLNASGRAALLVHYDFDASVGQIRNAEISGLTYDDEKVTFDQTVDAFYTRFTQAYIFGTYGSYVVPQVLLATVQQFDR